MQELLADFPSLAEDRTRLDELARARARGAGLLDPYIHREGEEIDGPAVALRERNAATVDRLLAEHARYIEVVRQRKALEPPEGEPIMPQVVADVAEFQRLLDALVADRLPTPEAEDGPAPGGRAE